MGLAIVGCVASPAAAKPTPAAKCLAAKLNAAGKKASAKLACEAKAAVKLKPVDSACLGKAETGFATAFAKAETQAKGACATTGDAGAVEATVDALVQSALAALPDGGTKGGGKCASSKRKATGKAALANLLCRSKAATKGTGVDPACIEKAEAAFLKAFTKAEQKGGCATTGDQGALDGQVGDFVDQVAAQLSGATSTTVTTTTVTTGPTVTTTVTTSSSTTMGPSLVTVMVGPGGNLVFDPASVTIKVGDTVRWMWATSFHSVVSGVVVSSVNMPDGKFCSPNDTNCSQAPLSTAGDVYDHTFTTAGTYPYFCAPHGVLGMTGTVVVQP
jgi:plastocyanin